MQSYWKVRLVLAIKAVKKSFGTIAHPTNSNRQEITDLEINTISTNLNISCNTDAEFRTKFVDEVFQHFGWTYLPMRMGEEYEMGTDEEALLLEEQDNQDTVKNMANDIRLMFNTMMTSLCLKYYDLLGKGETDKLASTLTNDINRFSNDV